MKHVAAAWIVNDGKVLIARRKKGETHAGFWEFPGGKIEENETPQSCLEREMEEELGLRVRAGRVITESNDHSSHGSFIVMAIEAEILEGELKLTVHDRAAWVDLQELKSFTLAPADKNLVDKILDHTNKHS